jgi:hypothetical protein
MEFHFRGSVRCARSSGKGRIPRGIAPVSALFSHRFRSPLCSEPAADRATPNTSGTARCTPSCGARDLNASPRIPVQVFNLFVARRSAWQSDPSFESTPGMAVPGGVTYSQKETQPAVQPARQRAGCTASIAFVRLRTMRTTHSCVVHCYSHPLATFAAACAPSCPKAGPASCAFPLAASSAASAACAGLSMQLRCAAQLCS